MPPESKAKPHPPAAETVANHGAESSSREYAQPAAGWCRSGSQNPARSSRCDRLAVGHAAVRTAPSPNSDRVAAPTAARKTAARASFVCPYKSTQKLSFISARKCWKCSLIGIIFAIGCRSPFQERLSLVRQSQLTPSRLLHNQRYVTARWSRETLLPGAHAVKKYSSQFPVCQLSVFSSVVSSQIVLGSAADR